MSLVIGIDPDTHDIGLAAMVRRPLILHSGTTIHIPNKKKWDQFDRMDYGIARVRKWIESIRSISVRSIAIEFPEIMGTGAKVRALIPLAALSFGIRQMCLDFNLAEEVAIYTPSHWKHPIPKHVWQRRLQREYPKIHKATLDMKLDHHSYDAIGLDLFEITGEKL